MEEQRPIQFSLRALLVLMGAASLFLAAWHWIGDWAFVWGAFLGTIASIQLLIFGKLRLSIAIQVTASHLWWWGSSQWLSAIGVGSDAVAWNPLLHLPSLACVTVVGLIAFWKPNRYLLCIYWAIAVAHLFIGFGFSNLT